MILKFFSFTCLPFLVIFCSVLQLILVLYIYYTVLHNDMTIIIYDLCNIPYLYLIHCNFKAHEFAPRIAIELTHFLSLSVILYLAVSVSVSTPSTNNLTT